MLKNYPTIALRTLRRHRGYTTLNVAGLAVGIACCLLILLFVRDELRYDRFHEHGERLYRVTAGLGGDGQPTNANGGFSWAPALKADVPGVEHAVRFVKMGWGEQRLVVREDRRFYEDRLYFADSTVFAAFTFPFVAGDPRTALSAPNTVVLTEATARRYFGDEDPLGQTLRIDPYNDGSLADYRVTGVLRDLPAHSHIQFDLLASFESLTGRTEGWGLDAVFTYVLLDEGADPAQVQAAFPAFLRAHISAERLERYGLTLHLQPVADIRLHSHLRAELEPNGDIAYVYLFSSIAVFILLLAGINFTNLATARAARRAREVGVRKVLGAHRTQLVRQFLGESMLTAGVALVLAVALAALLLPLFNDLAGKEVAAAGLFEPEVVGGLLLLTLVAGLLAGGYPALLLSSFRPATALKDGGAGTRRTARLRRGLVVFQFAVSIGLLVCTTVAANQMSFIRTKHLGFDREQVVVMPLNDAVRRNYAAVEDAWRQHAGVQAVTLSEQVPARAGNGSRYDAEGRDEEFAFTRLFVDPDFAETYGLEVAAGRDLSEAFPTDTASAFLITESAARQMGWPDLSEAVGKSLTMHYAGQPRPGTIVGVLRDFHLSSLHEAMDGVVLNAMPFAEYNFVSVRLAPGAPQEALTHLKSVWERFSPAYPFDSYFLDADFARLHAADARLARVFLTFAFLAMLIACLGLFGLAAYTAEQRTKEIGVRKVLGASIPGLVGLLSKDFLRLVALAFAIAAPVAYLAMDRWLADFAYRVEIGAGVFVAAGLATLAIALATVSYQSVKAATADPVKSLRYE